MRPSMSWFSGGKYDASVPMRTMAGVLVLVNAASVGVGVQFAMLDQSEDVEPFHV